MTPPPFSPVSLRELMDNGVLAMANEQFFWPFGLTLTWFQGDDEDDYLELHVREYTHPDGHNETIGAADDDEVMLQRRAAFTKWAATRLLSIPSEERAGGVAILNQVMERSGVPLQLTDDGAGLVF